MVTEGTVKSKVGTQLLDLYRKQAADLPPEEEEDDGFGLAPEEDVKPRSVPGADDEVLAMLLGSKKTAPEPPKQAPPPEPKPEPINAHELASKLSYFLWNGPPDRTTLRLASTGVLAKQLDAEVARMVESPRFARFVQEFTSQWLSLDKFNVLEPDRKKFPNLTRDTRAQLRQEPVQFVQHLMRKNLPAKNLIQSDFLIANEVVASYYDMPEKSESGFQFQAIPHGRKELGGILTQASILAGLSDGRESNPIKRGAWLARRIIAEPPADPPPNVPALKEGEKDLTLRQRLEAHRNQPGCFQCHQKIDPWGVAFEEFDAGGRLKKDPVDAHSKLPDQTEVSGANDLKRYLGEDRIDQVAFSVLKHLSLIHI